MKRIIIAVLLLITVAAPAGNADAQIPVINIVTGAIKRVIKAIDLKIQREQNKVIWLQNAQKEVENTLSKLKLKEISEWTQKQKDLYQKYFDELKQVKSIISYYQRIRDISEKQVQLVADYNRAWSLLTHDEHFSPAEIQYMGSVYSGILNETTKNVDQMMLVVSSFKTQMTDARRLKLLNAAADRVDRNYNDLQVFNRQNALLSVQRAHSEQEISIVKNMYGIH